MIQSVIYFNMELVLLALQKCLKLLHDDWYPNKETTGSPVINLEDVFVLDWIKILIFTLLFYLYIVFVRFGAKA